MPPSRKHVAAVQTVRRLIGEVYACDPRAPDLDTLCDRYGDLMPLDQQTLACWRHEDDWEGQRRALLGQVPPDPETRRIEKHLDFLHGLCRRAGIGMRRVRPRSHEQMMQVQLKCIELAAQLEAKLAEQRGPQADSPFDAQDAEEDAQADLLSAQDKEKIANIVLSAGRGHDQTAKPEGSHDAADA